ncbi:Proline dehydrogenase 1, mitochondrial [Myotis brandtii]|uniref:Proline dehydrogenase n=1 Tax=Myotis brandtii TaxID=109478 RepID=S7N2E1_MYOBR|nr:Proline dehydrogenase 1, mitochondrial [Myotis brandtii]
MRHAALEFDILALEVLAGGADLDAYDNVTLDLELARREGWCFGAKLVRGAYMAQERARAAEIGYEDPINPTYEATNAMYHRCLNYVLEELKNNGKAEVMVASHNEDTVRFTLRRSKAGAPVPQQGHPEPKAC